tara:strand:- start:953 stop:3070 length:2118 start_codon:yes stop_codon:yes gene_type:complete
MDSLLPSDPSSIDGYVIEGRLGSGGFGIVYGATSPDGRPVAVKVLRPELSDDFRLRERLAREADALSRVEGHRTAEIFEVVTEGDLVYLVMERVEGESLTDQVNDGGALSGPMLWFAATGLVQALQEIHAAGIVHRDLKPSNVMYGPDGVKVLDFGISVVADETSLTQTGAFVGTGAWMAPEMVLGNDITEKTDVYALGLVLAFIALGAHPFGEGRADALMYRILNSDPDLDGIPAPFIDAVSMCLQRDPDDRPTLDELGRFFGSNGEQQLSATSIVGSDTGGTRIVQSAATAVSSGGNRRRNALIGAGVATVLAVVGVIVGVTVSGGDDSENNPPELAEVEDTQLETDEVAFIQDDEGTVEPVEAVVTDEPTEEEPVAAEEPVAEETEEEPVVEEETVIQEQPTEDTEAALVALLTDTYEWGTASASKTMMLQEALGLTNDGSYGPGTRQAHLNALQERGLTIANVPEEPDTIEESQPDAANFACSITGVPNFAAFDWTQPQSGNYGSMGVVIDGGGFTHPGGNASFGFELLPDYGVDQMLISVNPGNTHSFPSYDWNSAALNPGDTLEWNIWFSISENESNFPVTCFNRGSLVVAEPPISCSITLVSNTPPNIEWQISFSPQPPPTYWWQIAMNGLNSEGDESGWDYYEGTKSGNDPTINLAAETAGSDIVTITETNFEVSTTGDRWDGTPNSNDWCYLVTSY